LIDKAIRDLAVKQDKPLSDVVQAALKEYARDSASV